MKPIYFLSDAHLGSLAIQSRRMQERRLVRFLDSIKHKAGAIYLLGDMFDFWFEYKTVVPKGYTRFLGKLSELTDLGVESRSFTFLRALFHNPVAQWLFAALHPRWGVSFGLQWAKHSRLKREDGREPPFQGEDKEPLILFAKSYLKDHPDINCFIFGHRHLDYDLMLSHSARVVLLGDWIQLFTYAVFDGEQLYLEDYIEGESEP